MEGSMEITIISAVASIIAAVWLFFKNRTEKLNKAHEMLLTWIPIAYDAVNEVSRKTKNKVDDKVALFLQKLNECIKASTGKELNKDQETVAQSVAQALRYQENTKPKK